MSNLSSSVFEYKQKKFSFPNEITENELNNDYNDLIYDYKEIKNTTDSYIDEYKEILDLLTKIKGKFSNNYKETQMYKNSKKELKEYHKTQFSKKSNEYSFNEYNNKS